jgi:hypothetical protein
LVNEKELHFTHSFKDAPIFLGWLKIVERDIGLRCYLVS